MRVLEISVNATSCNVVTVPPHDVIQKKMTPWVQLTGEGTWPHDRCVWGGSGYCGEKPPHTVISHVRLPGWGGVQKKERKNWIFFSSFLFPKSWFNHPLYHLFHTPSLAPDSGYYSSLLWRQKKETSQTENAEQIIFNRARDEFSCSSV